MNNPIIADQTDHTNDPAPVLTAEQYTLDRHARTLANLIDHSHKHHDKIARLERMVDAQRWQIVALMERVAQLEAERE